ncbi:M15 family metallopeptidase [Mycobacterium sp. IDR2000157661]|nr:M15 family metallopeptidase [Mycobacterium sp. IDR2000157661]ULE35736.1 M15 family metallopeptidase [Mycobacterium sp. IDR2000157661]
MVSACVLAACGTTEPPPPPSPPVGQEPLRIGPAAQDTVGGWLPDGRTLSPFDVDHPIVGWLDPALRTAVQDAARRAAADGIEMRITSGWRSKGFQERLFADGVATYGSVEAAREFVASPEKSKHITGEAVDIAPFAADRSLIANGAPFGLCQIYANEIWHFELAAVDGRCPPLKPNAAAG